MALRVALLLTATTLRTGIGLRAGPFLLSMERTTAARAATSARTGIAAALLLLASCQGTWVARPDNIRWPEPVTEAGLEVTVDGIEGVNAYAAYVYNGLRGTARNVTDAELADCSLSFTVLDENGEKLSRAFTETPRLGPGETWEFLAPWADATLREKARLIGAVEVEAVSATPPE